MNKSDKKGVYLVIADDHERIKTSVYYAAKSAAAHGAHAAVLYIMPEQDFSHWAHVEEKLQRELLSQAEEALCRVAEKIYAVSGEICGFYLAQGEPSKAILDVLRDNPEIVKLYLEAGTSSPGPGPLVSFFAGSGVAQVQIPVAIIPDHLDEGAIDALFHSTGD